MKRDPRYECWQCKHRKCRDASGESFTMIGCKRPDSGVTGDYYGVNAGWFNYPFRFDPIWKTNLCRNFEQKMNAYER